MVPEKYYKLLTIKATYSEDQLVEKEEFVSSDIFHRRSDAWEEMEESIQIYLAGSLFFRSPRPDYQLVRYEDECRKKTYLRLKIVLVDGKESSSYPQDKSL
jgi:hypothetical protein